MNKVYSKIVIYRPSTNEVQYLTLVPYETAISGTASDRLFYDVYERANKAKDIIIGITLGRSMYQLSPAVYGSYIKESEKSMELLNRSRILCAIARYHAKYKIPYED